MRRKAKRVVQFGLIPINLILSGIKNSLFSKYCVYTTESFRVQLCLVPNSEKMQLKMFKGRSSIPDSVHYLNLSSSNIFLKPSNPFLSFQVAHRRACISFL